MGAEDENPIERLVQEASRQLDICNACRYCEGYCAVFPALERRTLLDDGDVTQIANLCHDCRACYDACMYVPPHEFKVNIPEALANVRVGSYDRFVRPSRPPRFLRGWSGIAFAIIAFASAIVAIALVYAGPSALIARPSTAASPYDLVPYPALLAFVLMPALFSLVVLGDGGRRYWRHVAGSGRRPHPSSLAKATLYAATLRHLRGGGAGCYYPKDDVPSDSRRRLHGAVAWGFTLCFVSTASAAVMQDLLGAQPPYGVVSFPVLTGVGGGVLLAGGCTALIWMKRQASPGLGSREMTIKDYGLLVALAFLAVSGLATLLLRDLPGYGIVLLVHLSAIGATFAATPYSKFAHVLYRFLALVRDFDEIDDERARTDAAGNVAGRAVVISADDA